MWIEVGKESRVQDRGAVLKKGHAKEVIRDRAALQSGDDRVQWKHRAEKRG